jgi:NADH:ubiquinone oxidoreductase subunit K
MSKKILNPQRRRFLALITGIYAATYALWAVSYFTATAAVRVKMLFVIGFTSCVGFLGIGIIIALFYRFPVQKDEDKDPS